MPSAAPSAEPGPSVVGAREAQRLETRAGLFAAAVAEIGPAELGCADASAIATAAGVAPGTFCVHFPTKEHVIVELERNEEVKIVARLLNTTTKQPNLTGLFSSLVRNVLA